MTGFNRNIMNPIDRRAKARKLRALTRIEPVKTVDEAAAEQSVSRTSAYRMVRELETWEETATPQEEADEVAAQTAHGFHGQYNPAQWILVSGKLLFAYTQGHDGIGPALFGGKADSRDVIGVDPLLD